MKKLTVSFMLCWCCISAAFADESCVVLTEGVFPPWTFYNQATRQPELRGIVYDIGAALAGRLGRELCFEITPYARAQQRKATGKTDINFSIYHPEFANHVIEISPPLTQLAFSLWSHKSRPHTLKTLQHKPRIGVVAGSAPMFAQWFDNQNVPFYYVELATFEVLIKMLHMGRIDAAIVSDVSFYYENKRLGYAISDYAAPVSMMSAPWHIYVSQSSDLATPKNLQKIRQIARDFHQEGLVEQVKQRYR